MELDRVGTHVGGEVSMGENIGDAFRRRMLIVAGVSGALAVLIGAFGAHGLPDRLADLGVDAETTVRRLAQFDTGARYHLAHAIVLLVIATLPVLPNAALKWSAGLLVAGTVFFSGSLYVLVLTNTPWLGAITPIGGGCWIIAWTSLAFLRPTPTPMSGSGSDDQ